MFFVHKVRRPRLAGEHLWHDLRVSCFGVFVLFHWDCVLLYRFRVCVCLLDDPALPFWLIGSLGS